MTIDAHSESVVIAADPQAVYDLVTDVTRVGEWSPVCVGCEWTAGEPGRPGATFTGHNRSGPHEWSTTCTVVRAEPGRAFAWEVNGGLVHWAYELTPEGHGTRLTQHWEFRDAARAVFEGNYGEHAEKIMARRRAEAHDGIPASLAAIKRVAEGSAVAGA